MTQSYTGSMAIGVSIFIATDLAYLTLRSLVVGRDRALTLGRRGRVIEAAAMAVVVSAVGWVGYPLLFDPMWHGVAGIYIYGLLAIPIALGLHVLKRPILPPIGAGGLVSLVLVLLLIPVNGMLSPESGTQLADGMVGPLILSNVIGLFAGIYAGLTYHDDPLATEEENERDRVGIAGGNATNQSWASNNHNGGSSEVVVENPSSNTRPTYSTQTQNTNHTHEYNGYSGDILPSGVYDWERSASTFRDIGGYTTVKKELQDEIINPLIASRRGDSRFSRFGIEPERGVLLYGPPGTGKTMFARALAGELNVPFVELSPADVTSMWINESSDQVKTLFNEADEIGQCVVFLDEAEHLFGAREHSAKSAHAEDRKVTSEFLAQLTRDDREAIVVSATNRPGDIDRAILRPGRLTAHFEVGLPDEEARHAILEVHLDGIPTSVSGDELAALARHTDGLTGADLANLVGRARRSAANRNGRTVTREDFPSEDTLDELSAELAAENEADELPGTEVDDETVELPEATAGVRVADGTRDSEIDGPTRGYQ